MPRRAALNVEEVIHSAQRVAGEISSLVDGNAAAIHPEQGGHNPEDSYWSRVLSSESGLLKLVIIFWNIYTLCHLYI